MTTQTLILILFSVAISGVAQMVLKLGVSAASVQDAVARGGVASIVTAFALSPGVVGGLAMYGLGTVAWLGVLSRTPLSLAYPFVGLSFILTALFGYLVFNEALSPARLAGIALIIVGVALVSRG